MDTNLRGHDPGLWGHSLANLAEILLPLLDAVKARSVVEVGAYEGDLTRVLLGWARGSGATVSAVEPAPPPPLLELAEEFSELELVRETSHDALRHIELPDVLVIDGDHNYFTVREELRLVEERAPDELPLLMFHDVGWPHGRRDTFYAPDRIPEEYLESVSPGGYVFPGDAGLHDGGLPYRWVSEHEGGERNGVLAAVEDFVSGRDDVRFALVPAFFGFGAVWQRERPWADAVAEILDPWDRNPILARLEANRVFQLANEHVRRGELERLQERNRRQEHLLRNLLDSSAFRALDRIASVRHRGPGALRSWREQVKEVLKP